MVAVGPLSFKIGPLRWGLSGKTAGVAENSLLGGAPPGVPTTADPASHMLKGRRAGQERERAEPGSGPGVARARELLQNGHGALAGDTGESCPPQGAKLSRPGFATEGGQGNLLQAWATMSNVEQQRHKPPAALDRPRELVVACPPMRSNVNLSRIVRAASCCGVRRVICCGNAKILPEIARETGDSIEIKLHRSLAPVLRRLRGEGYALVGLEQTTDSQCLYDFAFPRKTALVVGNERVGIEPDVLAMLNRTVEIPVYGLPYSHNVATAAAMALYEYCRQYPRG